MRLEVDPTSEVPIYRQIRDRIVEGIATGALEPGASLPSVRALASALAMNPNTVVKAYDALRAEGFIAANKKQGTFVRGERREGDSIGESFSEDWRARLFTLLAEARAQGMAIADIEQACVLTLANLSPKAVTS